MDADLQHDERILEEMMAVLKAENLDIVVGSRYVQGGDMTAFSPQRMFVSKMATFLSRLATKADLKDPMSGFFMLKRSFFEKVENRLSKRGFKILLDLFASSKEDVK